VSDLPEDEQLGFDIEVDEESTAEHAHAPATEEPEAVIVAAALADRIFLQHAEARRGLTRIEQFRGR
jgi:hypothetical protein